MVRFDVRRVPFIEPITVSLLCKFVNVPTPSPPRASCASYSVGVFLFMFFSLSPARLIET